jgi:hypothetical protein
MRKLREASVKAPEAEAPVKVTAALCPARSAFRDAGERRRSRIVRDLLLLLHDGGAVSDCARWSATLHG